MHGTIKYSTLEDYPRLENRKLYAGWNFVTLTPDMVESISNQDLKLDEVTGNCDVKKAHIFFNGEWELFDWPEMDSTLIGKGMAMNVAKDCSLGFTGTIITAPPSLPN